jgi:hypothetical protein
MMRQSWPQSEHPLFPCGTCRGAWQIRQPETQTNETTIETDMVAAPQTFLFFGRDDRRGAAAKINFHNH